MFKLLFVLHISRHGTWTNQSSKKFKCQGYCLGEECWSSELIIAWGKTKLNYTIMHWEIRPICCSILLKYVCEIFSNEITKNFQDLPNPQLRTVNICYLLAKGQFVWRKTVTEVLKILLEAVGQGQRFQDRGHSF